MATNRIGYKCFCWVNVKSLLCYMKDGIPVLGIYAKGVNPAQMLQNVASDQGLQGLLKGLPK